LEMERKQQRTPRELKEDLELMGNRMSKVEDTIIQTKYAIHKNAEARTISEDILSRQTGHTSGRPRSASSIHRKSSSPTVSCENKPNLSK